MSNLKHKNVTFYIEKHVLICQPAHFVKFNSSLLKDKIYVGYMKGVIALNNELLINMNNGYLKWELMKMEICNATIPYCKTQAVLKREDEQQLCLD